MAETETTTAPLPADRLRAAAGVVRGWVAEAGPQPWAPGAVAAFGPEVAAWLDGEANRWDPEADIQSWDQSHERALAAADAILAAVSR